MANESSIKNILSNSLDQVRTIIDANTVMGTPINTPSGTTIIPISKLSMGFASGGLDLPHGDEENKSFGGGGGTGVTLIPVGILTVSPDGKVELLSLNAEKAGPIEQVASILDNTPSIIGRIKDVFTGENTAAEDTSEMEEAYSELLEDIGDSLTEKERRKIEKIEEKAAKRAAKKAEKL